MSGLSSRFSNAGYTIPKFMIDIDGKKVIEHIIDLYPNLSSCNVIYVFKLQAKLITDPYPNRSTKTGLSVEPPNKDTRSGHDEINIMKLLLCIIQ